MGTRYILAVTCERCGHTDGDVYYAPTCGFGTWECPCGAVVDLAEYSGITYEEASNRIEMEGLFRRDGR